MDAVLEGVGEPEVFFQFTDAAGWVEDRAETRLHLLHTAAADHFGIDISDASYQGQEEDDIDPFLLIAFTDALDETNDLYSDGDVIKITIEEGEHAINMVGLGEPRQM